MTRLNIETFLENNNLNVEALQAKLNEYRETDHLNTKLYYCATSRSYALQFFEILGTNTTVTSINLTGDKRTNLLVKALARNNILTLKHFVWHNCIGDEGAKALAEALETNATLTSINLTENNIGDEGAKALAEGLKTNATLTSINLGGNNIGDEGAKALAEVLKTNKTVTSINLLGNKIGAEGAKALAEGLKTNATLTSINLGAAT